MQTWGVPLSSGFRIGSFVKFAIMGGGDGGESMQKEKEGGGFSILLAI